MKKIIMQSAFVLQLVWFVMFFTNFLGFIGSRSELLQDIIWLGIPAIGSIVSILSITLRRYKILSIITLFLSVIIFGLWVIISGISQM